MTKMYDIISSGVNSTEHSCRGISYRSFWYTLYLILLIREKRFQKDLKCARRSVSSSLEIMVSSLGSNALCQESTMMFWLTMLKISKEIENLNIILWIRWIIALQFLMRLRSSLSLIFH